jgi:L-asparagine transporter-like permease
MGSTASLIANISAIVFGFAFAFFGQWAYSSQDPYEPKHLLFLFPLIAGKIFLAVTFLYAAFPGTSPPSDMKAWYLLLVGVSLLLLSYVILVFLEADFRKRKR